MKRSPSNGSTRKYFVQQNVKNNMKKLSLEELTILSQMLNSEINQIDNSLTQMDASASKKPSKLKAYKDMHRRRKVVAKLFKKVEKILSKNLEKSF